jgi:flagellar FliJ protein
MADLGVLIRLHKHELDEKRRVLGELYGEMALLERARRELERAFEQEKEAVARMDDQISYTFADYAETVRRQRKELDERETAMEKAIESAKESLMETFAELKKYEMTQEERDRIDAEELLFKESAAMDAIGLEGFRRKGSDEK